MQGELNNILNRLEVKGFYGNAEFIYRSGKAEFVKLSLEMGLIPTTHIDEREVEVKPLLSKLERIKFYGTVLIRFQAGLFKGIKICPTIPLGLTSAKLDEIIELSKNGS